MRIAKKFVIPSAALLALTSVAACSSDGDGEYPPSQVEVIVPWAAGGGADQATRQLAMAAEDTCNTRFVISNRTGAAGATGHEAIVGADANGRTLGAMTAEAAILPHLGGTNATVEDFTPVMRYASISPAFVVSADSPYESLDDLIAGMEAGETVRIGTTGRGGIWDIAAGGFEQEVGASFTERVPYDGGASIIQALLGGHIEAASLAAPEIVEQVQAGELRALAIADEARAEVLPDTPTLIEQGVDWSTATWFGIAGPADLAEEQVTYLHDCFHEAWEGEAYQTFLENMGFNAAYLGTEDFADFIDAQNEVFTELVPTLYE